jgi:hypothetical protein
MKIRGAAVTWSCPLATYELLKSRDAQLTFTLLQYKIEFKEKNLTIALPNEYEEHSITTLGQK